MNLRDKLTECIGSSQPLLTVISADYLDVEGDVGAICASKDYSWEMLLWDSELGLQSTQGVIDLTPQPPAPPPPKPGVPAALAAVAPPPPRPLTKSQQLLAAIE